jgi:hypothetical protein
MKTVYILNHLIDPQSDLGDIKIALQYTPLYCVLVSSIYDMQLAHQFSELDDILQITGGDEFVLKTARNYAEQSEMAVLIIGDAVRLDEVKEDGTREALVC